MASKFYKVVNLSSSNKYLPVPLVMGEIVMLKHDPEADLHENKYLKVFHNLGKEVSVFSKSYFKRYLPKKEEMKSLLKNKGAMPSTAQ
jgi:hypothetical protein